jgi:hypothetical protein
MVSISTWACSNKARKPFFIIAVSASAKLVLCDIVATTLANVPAMLARRQPAL